MPRAKIGRALQHRPERRHLARRRDRQQRQDPEQRVDLHRRDSRRRRVLRTVDGVHQRRQPAQPRAAQGRVPADAGQARRQHRRQQHDRVRPHHRAITRSSAPARWSRRTCQTSRWWSAIRARIAGWMCACGVKLASGRVPPDTATCAACSSTYRAEGARPVAGLTSEHPDRRRRPTAVHQGCCRAAAVLRRASSRRSCCTPGSITTTLCLSASFESSTSRSPTSSWASARAPRRADRADADRASSARLSIRPAGCGAGLRRHQFDARRRAGGRQAARADRARRGRLAVVQSHVCRKRSTAS